MRYGFWLSFIWLGALGLAAACSQSSSNLSAPSVSRPAAVGANADGSNLKASVPVQVSPINGTKPPQGQNTTLVINNSTLLYSSAGPLSYRFETSSTAGAVLESQVQAGGVGTTSHIVTAPLQLDATYRWRARAEYQGEGGPWSGYQTFVAATLEGYIRATEMFDPLTNGRTVGSIGGSGNITWVPGQGIQINDEQAFVVYQLPQTYTSGEISAEVSGLNPGGPCCKPRIFSILDRANAISSSSKYMINVQYRGAGGAPDNAIAWKAVLGDNGASLEPDTDKRNNSVYILDASKVYLWQAYWTPTSVRVVVNEGSKAGRLVYDYQVNAYTNTTNWYPEAMYAFVGTNNGLYVKYDGSRSGMIVKNLWVGNTPRPATIP
jgi:hypothetical protein